MCYSLLGYRAVPIGLDAKEGLVSEFVRQHDGVRSRV